MRSELTLQGAVHRIEGPLVFVNRIADVGVNEAVEVIGRDDRPRVGRIAALDHDTITVEVMDSTRGMSLADTRVRFHGERLQFAVGPDILGRVFDGVGRVIDGGPPISATKTWLSSCCRSPFTRRRCLCRLSGWRLLD